MLTAALNALVVARTSGLRRIYEAGLEGVTPLMVGLAILGGLIWVLSLLARPRTEEV